MDFDNFSFSKLNGDYTLSLVDYLCLVQQSSEHETIRNLEYFANNFGDESFSRPDIYIEHIHTIHVFNKFVSPNQDTYIFTGAGNFLYYIANYPVKDRVITQMQFLRYMHDELHACMGLQQPFADNRQSRYEVNFKPVDGVVKLFHVLTYDTGFKAVFDQSFKIVDVYYQQKELEKFKDNPLEEKKIIFTFFNVYFRSQLLRHELKLKYEDLSFEEIRDYLTLHRMVSI